MILKKSDFDLLKNDLSVVTFRLNNAVYEMELLEKNLEILKNRCDSLYKTKTDFRVFDDRISEVERILNNIYLGGDVDGV